MAVEVAGCLLLVVWVSFQTDHSGRERGVRRLLVACLAGGEILRIRFRQVLTPCTFRDGDYRQFKSRFLKPVENSLMICFRIVQLEMDLIAPIQLMCRSVDHKCNTMQ